MGEHIAWGMAVVIFAGLLNGSFAAPMKRMTAWRWENTWLTFAVSGLLIFPWLITTWTIPHLRDVYAGATTPTLAKVFIFGVLWGVGAMLLGLGISRVGLALGFSIILGITASFGALIPLAVLHPEELFAKRGLALWAGSAIMIVGLIFLAIAGSHRERESGVAGGAPRSGFTIGLIICIFSGLFSSLLNFAFTFGDELRVRALAEGATATMASNPIWALAVSGGFVANAAYCLYLLQKNKTWSVYGERNTSVYWPLGALTGLLWFGGTLTYGSGAAILGTLGGEIGWPVFMVVDIIAGLFWGMITGEWKAASRRTMKYCWTGVAILMLAIAVISVGSA
jgi:L-rhamnose-H+ transport protein